MSVNILSNTNKPEDSGQERSSETERYMVFRFEHGLGKGIKARIKSLGCIWNVFQKGWICPLEKKDEVQKALYSAKLVCTMQIIDLPKGIIPLDPKIAGKQSQLEILEEQIYSEEGILIQDVYRYDRALRPEDFSQMPAEEGKTQDQIIIENDFHNRWTALQKKREKAEQVRNEISHLEADKGEKTFDPDAPLLIADALIKEQFLWQQYRTLHYCSNMFWQWNGIKYVELTEGAMRNRIYEFLRDAKEMKHTGHLKNLNPTKFKVDQIIDALRAVCHHDHHPASSIIWLDGRESPNPRYLISFKNGLLNIEDWLKNPLTSLMPHTPLLFNVNSLTFDFDPKIEKPKEWLQFLNSIWPEDQESQETLQEWIGYLLIHDTRLHKILLIIGPTRSGKGTIGRCLMELLGPFNVIGPTLSSLGGEFGLQPFLNKMLALISDVRLNSKGNTTVIIERLLSISGEDPLTINRKFLPPMTVQLSTRFVLMSNEIPEMQDASGALAKRYIILTLKKSWLGSEDTSLSNRLLAELPGILLWSLHGLARLQARGKFIQPASSVQIIEELEAVTSPIKAFVADECEFKPQAIVSVAALFNAWRCWCGSTGYPHPGNVQSFCKKFRAAFPEIEATRPQGDQTRERCYKGIALIPSYNSSADVRGQK